MTLFKYIRPERIDVIEKCEIRFTQPGALNDPFELRPRFESLVAEADVLANLDKAPVDLGPMVEEAYAMLPEAYRTLIPLDVASQSVEAFMATDEARDATSMGIKVVLGMMKEGAAQIREEMYRAFNDNVGILSLSEIPDNELMWAHYAERHTGLVLCFDEQHGFFNRKRSENDGFYFVRKVIYDDAPASSMASLDGDALLVSKGTKWAYEREWRMLVPLRDATRSLIIAGDTVRLFAFPSDALKGVIIGAHATPAIEASLQDLLKRNAGLRHIQVSRATLDLTTRSVRVSWP